ncbi:MAG: ferrochelatase [Magnetococcales bacterium]|nr:ferrochelatase [Magnetococcales bacterium]
MRRDCDLFPLISPPCRTPTTSLDLETCGDRAYHAGSAASPEKRLSSHTRHEPKDTKALPHPAIGVLLIQLGTPSAPDPAAVRQFLREFLSDRRVVDLPRWQWLPILHGIILPRRSPRSAALYQKIWRDDGISPLLHHSRAVTTGIQDRLGDAVQVALAMRYGQPGIAQTLHTMSRAGIQRLLIVPLFPQYSSATTATITDAVCGFYLRQRFQPALRFAAPFFQDPAYIKALGDTIRHHLDPAEPREWIFSFHGLPQRFAAEGDPYPDQCQQTARLLAEELHLSRECWHIGYQSRFGREAWLTPDTAHLLKNLPREGKPRLAIVCPGFVADCLETLEEIGVQGRENFLHAGGEEFHHLPCLNDSPAWIDALSSLIRRELSGWLEEM